MAIYKPSNCLPFLSCLDLTKPQNISCELNTSNETVTGYKIKILDSNNDVVFEGAEFSSINPEGYNNSGTNGSTLTLPLIVEGENEPKNPNIIYYANGKFATNEKSFFKSDKFSNDYANQPYKWEITLSQTGDSNIPNKPKSNEYYDMVLGRGKILGSNRNRLQSALSENITKDYFIQLNNREIRVPIKSYDYSFGYVYPKENVLTDEEVNSASYFKIYKFSNDPEVVSAASQVLIKTTRSMNEVMIDGHKNTVSWGENLVFPNYFTQKFEGISGERNDLPISAYDTSWNSDDELTDDNNKLGIGSVIMIAKEGNGSSAYNGIFNLQSINNEKGSDGKYTVTVKWLRNAASDTWATLTNKVYYVQHGSAKGNRYQVNTEEITGVGVINSSIVKFEDEKAVELYTDVQAGFKDKTEAPIYKNAKDKAYIRPYSGPKDNVRLAYIKPNSTEFKYVDGNISSDGWYFAPKNPDGLEEAFVPDEVSYKILTFFNNSDENPFYAKISPIINITSQEIQQDDSPSSLTNYKCVGRVLNVKGEITGRKWVNFKWVLTDLNMNQSQYTDVTYAGDMQATFYGLQNDHIYELSLTIEDEFGDVWVEQKTFEVILNIVESEFPFTATYECETQSVLLDFSKKGIITPTPSIMNYKNHEGYDISYDSNGLTLGDVDAKLQEDSIPNQLMEYKNQRLGSWNFYGEITPPSSDDITLNSQHILNPNFTGTVVSYKIDTKDFDLPETYLELNIIVLPVQNYSQEYGGYVANNDRNVLFLQVIKKVNGKEILNSNKEISLYESVGGKWENVKTNRWQKNNQIAFSLVAPGTTINEGVDYIETTNPYKYENGSQSLTKYQNIFESYNSNKTLMGSPLIVADRRQGSNYNVWSNKKLAFIQQTRYGNNINVKTNEFNEWKTKEGNSYYYWHIRGNGGAPTYFVKANHSGRQNISKYKFTFNIVVKDYNTKTINNDFISNNIVAKVFKETV